jgi:hypothetical protein
LTGGYCNANSGGYFTEFQGHHTNQAYYELSIMSTE